MSIAEKLTLAAENVPKVYEAGFDKGTSDFWDNVQGCGERNSYEYGFCYWDNEYIRPKYKVVPTSRTINMFQHCEKLKIVEKKYFDLSNTSCLETIGTQGNYYTFGFCTSLETIEDIGLKSGYYYSTFWYCFNLKTIELLRSTAGCVYHSTFNSCNSLENITFEGEIGQNISFQWSPLLTHESLMSIINALVDYSEDAGGTTYTLTIGTDNIAKLSADEIAIIENKGWNYA